MAKEKLTEAEQKYLDTKEMLMDFWKNLAINIFEWKGLEEISESLTSEIIEQWLYEDGKALFFNDEMLSYMCLKFNAEGGRNVYNKATNFRAVGINYNKAYNTENSVVIKNNALSVPTQRYIEYYCSKLAEIEMTIDLRRDTHKTPFMLECTKDTELSARNYFKKIRASEPVMFKNKTRTESEVGIEAINTDNPYISDKLIDEYNNYVAKILTILGLDNFCEDKAERVQSAEVNSQQEFIISSFRTALEARKKACDKINKMFGLNLSVDYVKAEQIETTDPVEDEDFEEVE